MVLIIDGKNAVLGRLASRVAKALLAKEEVVILNAEKVLITGNPSAIKERWLATRRRGGPHHGPFVPVSPDRLLRRTIRGMLPYKKDKTCLRRLKCFVGVPEEYNNKEAQVMIRPIKCNYVELGEVARLLGWRD
jgi:large subunit ribosomal protein L13